MKAEPSPTRVRLAEVFFFLDMGGVERCIVDLVNGLSPEEFERQVIVSHHGGMMEKQLSSGIAFTGLPPQHRMLHLIQMLEFVDVAHIHTTNMNPFFTWSAAMADVPVILETVHASVDNSYASHLDHTVCVSRFVQNLQSRPERSSVIYNGVPVPLEKVQPRSCGKDTVVLVEMRRPDKELKLSLVDLYDRLECEKNRIECWILGVEGRSRGGLRFLGKVPDPLPHLARADFLFHFPLHEAFSLAIIEGMSCGLIPVTHKVGGIPEIVQDGFNGICREGLGVEEIAGLIQGLIREQREGSGRLRTMRKNGWRTVKESFDASQVHRSYQVLLHDLWNQKGGRCARPLRELLTPGGPESHPLFLAILEECCFDKIAWLRKFPDYIQCPLTARQKGFLLGIAGRELHLQNRHEEARRLLSEALEAWEGDFYIHLFLGETERALGYTNRAWECFRNAYAMDRTNMLGIFGYLQSLVERRDFAEAGLLCQRMNAALATDNPARPFIDRLHQKIASFPVSPPVAELGRQRD